MSEADIEALKKGYADFNRGDFEEAVTALDDEVEWVDPTELPGATTHNGHDEVVAWWRSWTDAWGEIVMDPTEYVDAGHGVYFVPIEMRASGAASGVPIDMSVWAVWWFEGAKPRRVAHYLDQAAARRVAGLPA